MRYTGRGPAAGRAQRPVLVRLGPQAQAVLPAPQRARPRVASTVGARQGRDVPPAPAPAAAAAGGGHPQRRRGRPGAGAGPRDRGGVRRDGGRAVPVRGRRVRPVRRAARRAPARRRAGVGRAVGPEPPPVWEVLDGGRALRDLETGDERALDARSAAKVPEDGLVLAVVQEGPIALPGPALPVGATAPSELAPLLADGIPGPIASLLGRRVRMDGGPRPRLDARPCAGRARPSALGCGVQRGSSPLRAPPEVTTECLT